MSKSYACEKDYPNRAAAVKLKASPRLKTTSVPAAAHTISMHARNQHTTSVQPTWSGSLKRSNAGQHSFGRPNIFHRMVIL